ncbi:unnamed protein product [Chilo suppressalis]|uniref:Uncharacterized protein n=1 Tax=Chilo suppressalis TaxID=168631 RepID=A0ABN8B448_CHISP|nr:unnamed protein product [Chilo suppressalis]
MKRNAVMEYLTSVGALKTVKMLVLSNMFRAQNQVGPRGVEALAVDKMKKCELTSQSSLRIKHRTKTHDDVSTKTDDTKSARREKCLSSSVDAIITRDDIKNKVICSAKGLLETNLDDLFDDVGDWSEPKSLGASEPTLSYNEDNFRSKRGSLVSEDDSGEDTATDSDCLDEVAREQRICLGARRIGHILRRVISRNGELEKYI